MRGRRLGLAAAAVLLALAGALLAVGSRIESWQNRVEPVPLPAVGERARALHRESFVVDLHADSLLFGRDLLARSDTGHVDLPRLREGGVGLQVFTLVTSVPWNADIDGTPEGGLDALTLMGLAQLSPFLWRGPFGRAELQVERLGRAVAGSGGGLVPVATREDLEALVAARAAGGTQVGALLGVEGAHAFEGDPEAFERLYARGLRMVGLAHFTDNDYAGSAHGVARGGLREPGLRLLARMQELGVLVDLAHLSPRAIEETLERVSRPVLVSHTGVRATCDSNRNLSDSQLDRIARNGGVVGIGFWRDAVCGIEPRDVVAAIAHAIDRMGDDHVALGSDWDGATTVGFDASRLPALTQAMLDAGLPEATVRKVLGGNALRVLRAVLPRARPQAAQRGEAERSQTSRMRGSRARPSRSSASLPSSGWSA